MAETQGPPPGAPQGPPPNPLFLERMGRIQTAIHCGTPDRVPLSLVLDTFACNTMGVKYSEFCADLDVAGQTMLAATEKLGDVDSVQWATYAPADPRHGLARADEAPRPRPARGQPVAAGRAGAHPAGGLRPHRRDGLGSVVRPVHRQVPGRGGGGRRGAAGEGAALGRRVHGARLRGVQRLDGRPPVRAPLRRPDHPGIHHGPVHPAGQGRGRDAGHHGREARADAADDPRHRAVRLLGRQLAHGAAVPLAQALGPLRLAVHEGARRDRRRGGRHPDAALRRRLGPRDRAPARAAGAHLRARHRRGRPTSSAPRRSWAATCA